MGAGWVGEGNGNSSPQFPYLKGTQQSWDFHSLSDEKSFDCVGSSANSSTMHYPSQAIRFILPCAQSPS